MGRARLRIPTQAKGGLEWATRLSFKMRLSKRSPYNAYLSELERGERGAFQTISVRGDLGTLVGRQLTGGSFFFTDALAQSVNASCVRRA